MTDDRLAPIAKVIETPKLDDATATDTRMLARLRAYAAGADTPENGARGKMNPAIDR